MSKDYDAYADFGALLDECYRAIRERIADGGPPWVPRERDLMRTDIAVRIVPLAEYRERQRRLSRKAKGIESPAVCAASPPRLPWATPTIFELPGRKRVRPRHIVRAVAAAAGSSEQELLGERRHGPLTLARHAAMWLIKKRLPEYSFGQIGRLFRRDHTSVRYAVRRIGKLREANDKATTAMITAAQRWLAEAAE